jgi:hypothetical protein
MARFTEYPQGLAIALAAPAMQRALELKMAKAYARAIAIAPVRTGLYRSRFRVVSGVRNGKAYARLLNDARDPRTGYPYCLALEFGTKYMKRQRILGRAADALRT